MALIDRIHDVRLGDLSHFIPFVVDGLRVGRMKPEFAAHLADFGDVFQITPDRIILCDTLRGHEQRTKAVAEVLQTLRERGLVPGWRGELYPVTTEYQADSLFHMERAATILFGLRVYGINVNGYVKLDNRRELWVAKRSMEKVINPGKLDNIVAGGHPVGISVLDNLVKECQEEANIPPSIALRARPVSGISYIRETETGIYEEFCFVYDLELPVDFTPQNMDGEVASFRLWGLDKVEQVLAETRDFSYDAALTTLDFLLRHGTIEADHPDYQKLVMGLRYQGNDEMERLNG
jgi:hypothetical protein